MVFDPHIADRRFGYGRAPGLASPSSLEDMLAGVSGPDAAQAAFPIADYRSFQEAFALRQRFYRFYRRNEDTQAGRDADARAQEITGQMRAAYDHSFVQLLLRRTRGTAPFRERLVAFWSNHFVAMGRGAILRMATPHYVEEAVRPHISGRFEDLLFACVTHPIMLHYLDQDFSAGPGSPLAKRRPGRVGLNENLAREVMELHTLGADGPYGQQDVRQLAELLAGLSRTRNYSFKFRTRMTEPGGETVLGETYDADGGLDTVRRALADLARHPATARHIAGKLAAHFVADDPPAAMTESIAEVFLATEGDLMACYAALLVQPAAWAEPARNIRPPDEFLSAALRALDPDPEDLQALGRRDLRRIFYRPLEAMGQPWLRPPGPDGFAEEDEAWITPQGVSARLEWAMDAPARLLARLPDPREFVDIALGAEAPERVRFAASAAEDRATAIGLVLSAPAFQRR